MKNQVMNLPKVISITSTEMLGYMPRHDHLAHFFAGFFTTLISFFFISYLNRKKEFTGMQIILTMLSVNFFIAMTKELMDLTFLSGNFSLLDFTFTMIPCLCV